MVPAVSIFYIFRTGQRVYSIICMVPAVEHILYMVLYILATSKIILDGYRLVTVHTHGDLIVLLH